MFKTFFPKTVPFMRLRSKIS